MKIQENNKWKNRFKLCFTKESTNQNLKQNFCTSKFIWLVIYYDRLSIRYFNYKKKWNLVNELYSKQKKIWSH